jgi:hypothetical protein
MADRECDAAVTESSSRTHDPDRQPALPTGLEQPTVAALPCPECHFPRLTLVSDGDIVSVLKCPRCGHLAAPLKRV